MRISKGVENVSHMLLEKRWIQIIVHRHYYSFSLQMEMGLGFDNGLCRLFAYSSVMFHN